jgi:hypothetical protein
MTTLGPFGFHGGVNVKTATNVIGPNQMSDAQNVYFVGETLCKLFGSRTLNASAVAGTPAITGISDWQTAAGQRYQVITSGTKIFSSTDLSTTFTDVTGAVTITTGNNNQSTFGSVNNLIIRCGGETPDAPIKWSGTGNAAALGGTPPVGNICHTVNNFLFITGVAAAPSRLYWSNVIDPETWGAASYVDFRKDDGDKITALSHIDQNLIVFKRNAILRMDTTTTAVSGTSALGAAIESIIGTGCAGANAVDNLPDGKVVFLGTNNHVYIYDGSVIRDISDQDPPGSNIQPWLDSCVRGKYSIVRYYPTRNQIWVSTTSSGQSTNDVVFIYDYLKNVWCCKTIGRAVNAMCTAIDTRATINHAFVLLTGNYAGQVYEQDYGNNNPEDTNNIIDGYGTTTIQFAGEGETFKPRSIMSNYQYQGEMSLQLNYGYNDFSAVQTGGLLSENSGSFIGLDSFVLDVNTLGSAGPIRKTLAVNTKKITSSMQVQYRNNYAAQPFTVNAFWISDELLPA